MRPADNMLVLEAAAVGYAAYMATLRLSQRLSPLSSHYRALSATDRLEWDGRMPSTLHAIISTAVTTYLFFCTTVFSHDPAGDKPFVLRTSPLTDAALGFSLGYFSTDLLLVLVHYPDFGGLEIAVHHVAALASLAAAAFQAQGHAYTLALLATECTTPFVNLRFVLEKGGYRHHPLYTVNGMLLLFSWMLGRIVLFGFFFHHVFLHLGEFHLMSAGSRLLIYTVPPTLFTLNLLWFIKIFRGAMKLVFRPSSSKASQKAAEQQAAPAVAAPVAATTAAAGEAAATVAEDMEKKEL